MQKLNINFEIPQYLDKSINNYIIALNKNDLSLDCYFYELRASINMAESFNEITKNNADLLRNYYL